MALGSRATEVRSMTTTEGSTGGLEVGTEIYYTGDMANASGFGYVGEVKRDERFGTQLVLQLDDGRRFSVSPMQFQPSPGRRFCTKAEWEAEREERIRNSPFARRALGRS